MIEIIYSDVYQESGNFKGLTLRWYNNGVEILYKIFTEEQVIQIAWIQSDKPNQGHGTVAMKHFMEEFLMYKIVLGSTTENVNWYKSLGFINEDKNNYLLFSKLSC